MNKIELQDPTNYRNRIIVCDVNRYLTLKLMGWLPVNAIITKPKPEAKK